MRLAQENILGHFFIADSADYGITGSTICDGISGEL